jgi:Predicted sugar kinase
MKKIEQVLIIANGYKDKALEIAHAMASNLEKKSVNVIINPIMDFTEEHTVPRGTDLLISIGGDGTVLYSARLVQKLGIPIMAVNLGTFGYITEIGASEWENTLDGIFNDDYSISRRLMLRVTVIRKGKSIWQELSLNEAVVTSSGLSKIIRLGLSLDNTRAGTFRSDGIIIATPTGSTGYSLAAGGPILDVEMGAIIVTPICPFTLSNRPLVTDGEKTVAISVLPQQRTDIILTVDGQLYCELEEGDQVVVEKSRSKALLISSKIRNYTEVVRDKLHWSGELHA